MALNLTTKQYRTEMMRSEALKKKYGKNNSSLSNKNTSTGSGGSTGGNSGGSSGKSGSDDQIADMLARNEVSNVGALQYIINQL